MFKPLFSQSFHSKQHSSHIFIPRRLHRRSCLMLLQPLKGLEMILILDFCCFHLTILLPLCFLLLPCLNMLSMYVLIMTTPCQKKVNRCSYNTCLYFPFPPSLPPSVLSNTDLLSTNYTEDWWTICVHLLAAWGTLKTLWED